MFFASKIAAMSKIRFWQQRVSDYSNNQTLLRMSYIHSIFLFIVLFLTIENVNGKTWKWTGNLNNNWNVADNWDQQSIPPNNSTVVIGYVSSGVYPELGADVSVSSITISDWSGGELTITNGATLTVNRSLDIQGYGELILDNGTLQFNGDGSKSQDINMAYGNTSIRIINSGIFNSPNSKLQVNGELTLESGTINLGNGFVLPSGKIFSVTKGNINIFGEVSISGTINGGVGDFVFDGNPADSNHKVTISSGGHFYMSPSSSDNQSLDCPDPPTSPEPSYGTVSFITPCYIRNSGYFYGGNAYVSFYKSITPSGTAVIETHNGTLLFKGDLTVGSSTVNITCEGTIQVEGNTTLGSSGYINATGGNIYFDGNVKTENSSGTINAGTSTIVFSGDSFENEGYFNAETSTFIFAGDGTQLVSTYDWRSDNTFYNVIIEESADVQSTQNLVIANDLELVGDGSLTVDPDKTLEVGGSVSGEGDINIDRPFILSILINSSNTITAVFNAPLDASSSQNAGNYRIENEAGNSIDYPSNPTLGGANNNEVTLDLGFNIVLGVKYYLVVNNIKDLNGNTVSNNHTRLFFQTEPANLWRWSGAIDSDWGKPENWEKNMLPQTDSHVLIPVTSNNPIISSQGNEIYELEIKTGASLAIGSTGNISVDDSIFNEVGVTGLIVESNSYGTGSLIQYNNSVPATFQRYISGESQAWQMISSPVANQEISGEFTPTGGSDAYGDNTRYDFYAWYEPDTSWVYLLNNDQPPTWLTCNGSTNFLPGRGYLISYKDDHPTKTFRGNLNNGPVSIQLNKTADTGAEFGFNLVGNPYSSSIDWKSSGWGRSNLENSGGGYDIWIWSETNMNYGAYNSASDSDNGTLGVSRYIAPTQGFFVKAGQAGELFMDNSVRVHAGAGNWLKSAATNQNKIIVDVESSEGYGKDEVVVEFGHSKPLTGTPKRFSFVPAAPSLYLPDEKDFYSIRLLGEKENYPVFPVSFKAGVNGSYNLSVSFDSDAFEVLELYDKVRGEWHDLKENVTYSFQADSGDKTDRFIVQITPGNFADPTEELPVLVYSNQNRIVIDLRLVEGEYKCDIFTITGQKFMTTTLFGKQISNIEASSANAIVIVQITGETGRKIAKVPIVY